MKSKNKTAASDQNRPSDRDVKQKTSAGQSSKSVRNDRGVQDENQASYARTYYSRNGGHAGYNGL